MKGQVGDKAYLTRAWFTTLSHCLSVPEYYSVLHVLHNCN